MFGDHPLGRPVLASAEVISSVTRRSIGAFHRAQPDNVVVAAAGSVDHDARRSRPGVRGTARRRAERRPVRVRPFMAAAAVARFVRKETEQYHVCLGAGSRGRTVALHGLDPGRDPRGVGLVAALQEIREKRGLAYAVYTFTSQYADTGQVGVYVGTREDNLGECPTWSRTSWLR